MFFRASRRMTWVSAHMLPMCDGYQLRAGLAKWAHMALLSLGTAAAEHGKAYRDGRGLPTRHNTEQLGCPKGFVDFSDTKIWNGEEIYILLRKQATEDADAVALLIGALETLLLEDGGSEIYVSGLVREAARELDQL